MRDVSRRDLMRGVAGSAAATSLAGCIGSEDEEDPVSFWSIFWESENHDPYADWFGNTIEKRTDREFELTEYAYSDLRQNVLTGGRTGTPDVIEGVIEHPGDYVGADILEPLTDKTDQIDHFDGFVESALDAFRFQGELWALPYVGNGRALVYRTDVLEEYGYEEPPADAEEFMELAGTINDDTDMNGFHLTTERGEVRVTQEFLSHVYQHSPEGLFQWDGSEWALQPDASDFEEVLDTFYYGLFHGDNPAADMDYRGAGWESNDEGYTRGENAMIHCGPWIDVFRDTEDQEKVLDEHTAISLLPKNAGATDGTYMEVKPVMVNKHSENKEAALEAASLFSSPEALEELATVDSGNFATPVHEAVDPVLPNDGFEAFVDAFKNGVAPAPIRWGPVREAIYDAIEGVLYEESDPASSANDLETTLIETDVSLEEE